MTTALKPRGLRRPARWWVATSVGSMLLFLWGMGWTLAYLVEPHRRNPDDPRWTIVLMFLILAAFCGFFLWRLWTRATLRMSDYAISQRRLFGRTEIRWEEATRIGPGQDGIVVKDGRSRVAVIPWAFTNSTDLQRHLRRHPAARATRAVRM